MKRSTIALVAVSVVVGAASYFGWTLTSESDESAASADPARGLETHSAELAKSTAMNDAGPPTSKGSASTAGTAAAPTAIDASRTGAMPEDDAAANANVPSHERRQIRSEVEHAFGDYSRVFGLSGAETNALYDLLTQHETAVRHDTMPDDANGSGAQEQWSERQLALGEKEVALLGESRAKRLWEYQESFAARAEIAQLGERLADSSSPLSEAQRRRTIQAIIDDRQQFPGPALYPGQDQEDAQRVFGEWQRAQAQRLTEVARTILSAQQMQELNKMRTEQLEFIRQANEQTGAP